MGLSFHPGCGGLLVNEMRKCDFDDVFALRLWKLMWVALVCFRGRRKL